MFLGIFMNPEGSLVYVVIWHCDFCRPLLYFSFFEKLSWNMPSQYAYLFYNSNPFWIWKIFQSANDFRLVRNGGKLAVEKEFIITVISNLSPCVGWSWWRSPMIVSFSIFIQHVYLLAFSLEEVINIWSVFHYHCFWKSLLHDLHIQGFH